jgi:hypothetical protein
MKNKFISSYFAALSREYGLELSEPLSVWIGKALRKKLSIVLGFNPSYPEVYLNYAFSGDFQPRLENGQFFVNSGLNVLGTRFSFQWRWHSSEQRDISLYDTKVDDLVLEIDYLPLERIFDDLKAVEPFTVPQTYPFPVEVKYLRHDPLIVQIKLSDFQTAEEIKILLLDFVGKLQEITPQNGVIHSVRVKMNKTTQTLSFVFDFGSADPSQLLTILSQLKPFDQIKKVILHSNL